MSDRIDTAGEVRKLRRELGLCVDCGNPIEPAERGYKLPPIRCAACREHFTQMKYESMRIRKQREARRAEAERRTHVDYGAALESSIRPSAVGPQADLESLRDSNLRPPRAMCERCEWATYVGSTVWFCPLAVCKLAKIVDVVSE